MDSFDQRAQQALYDRKWHKLLGRSWLFRHVPFIDFVFGAGSMAVGNVTETSDFDVLVGARQRRIFTARFFSVLLFGLLRWRRSKRDGGAAAADKICLNHFITPAAYRFSLPRNPYWDRMYRQLVPIFGSERPMRAFLSANEAMIPQPKHIIADQRYCRRGSSWLKRSLERLLGGTMGDWFEQKVKAIQTARIKAGIPAGDAQRPSHSLAIRVPNAKTATYHLPPLIRYNDNELEFHPDPAVIEVLPE